MLTISIRNKHQDHTETDITGPAVLGRRSSYSDARAIVVDDPYASRSHVRVEKAGTRILVKNVSEMSEVSVDLPQKQTLAPGEQGEFAAPVSFRFGRSSAEVHSGILLPDDFADGLTTIGIPVGTLSQRDSAATLGASPSPERLIKWFETLVTVQKSAAGTDEFYHQTARAVVDLVDLDAGMVLLRDGDGWNRVADYPASADPIGGHSDYILKQVLEQRRTFFRLDTVDVSTGSLLGVGSVVASPVFDSTSEQVIGAVYGVRRGTGRTASHITPLEAQLVQVLAAAVGSGLARKQEEAEAARRYVQFQEFVSPQVAIELDRNPNLLSGQDTEITILFVDIRNFSGLSERLGAGVLCEVVQSIMEHLAGRVREHNGTTVSYLGDGMLAMWNAPIPRKDHADVACRAALAMIEDMTQVNEQWRDTVGEPLKIGIGINSGIAMVGNTGSRLKPQYGPLGDSVNLASRVEGITKKVGIPILITGATKELLGSGFCTRRLCRVRVVGKSEPVDLFELHGESGTPEWNAFRDTYETALQMFESGRWHEACMMAFPLLRESEDANDGPTLNLLGRSMECLSSPPDSFDPVWNLTSK